MSFHPWRALRNLIHLDQVFEDLGDEQLGRYEHDRHRIVLNTGMTQAERRSTLTHELVHAERGPVGEGDREREERIVDEIAARRLIPLEALVDGLMWSYDETELADHLWVDVPTVQCRLRTLYPREAAFIDAEMDRREMTF